ncbi:Transcription factor COE1 [Entomophthora muscae]|uniref:Transcription factor COE1 n=1 Tax=Entomophthora muscae TaxID=34485 RepID=A0ACC2U4X2_9FUNG|nr:Transcription factor COE1 [Entomophthora muscae]
MVNTEASLIPTPTHKSKANQIRELDFSHFRALPPTILDEIAGLVGSVLTSLDLSNIENLTDVNLLMLSKNQGLRSLKLRRNDHITDFGLKLAGRYFKSLNSITLISLKGITAWGLERLCKKCSQIQSFIVKSCPGISERGIRFFTRKFNRPDIQILKLVDLPISVSNLNLMSGWSLNLTWLALSLSPTISIYDIKAFLSKNLVTTGLELNIKYLPVSFVHDAIEPIRTLGLKNLSLRGRDVGAFELYQIIQSWDLQSLQVRPSFSSQQLFGFICSKARFRVVSHR